MEEKKRNELTDEQVDEVSGGGDGSRQYVKANKTVPIFALPGAGSMIIGELQKGKAAECLGQEGEWYQIYDFFLVGWVQSRYVSINNV